MLKYYLKIIVILTIIIAVPTTFQQSYSETNEEEEASSPKKQVKIGISPFDVQCKGDMQLIFKYNDKTPACFKISSATHVKIRGWGDSGWDKTTEYLYQIEPKLSRSITLEISEKMEKLFGRDFEGNQNARPIMTVTEKIIHPEPIEVIEVWRLSNNIIKVTDTEGNDVKNRESELNSGHLRDAGRLIYGMCPDGERKPKQFAIPFTVAIKPNVSSDIIVTYPYTKISHDAEGYHLKFASLYDTTIEFPENTTIVKNESEKCDAIHHIYSDVYSYDITFRLSK